MCRRRRKSKKTSFEDSKMRSKPYPVFFLKQQNQQKYFILNKELQLITKHKSCCLFSLLAAQNKQKSTLDTKNML